MNKKTVASIAAIIVVIGLCTAALYAKTCVEPPQKDKIAQVAPAETVSHIDVIDKKVNPENPSKEQEEAVSSGQAAAVTEEPAPTQTPATPSQPSQVPASGTIDQTAAGRESAVAVAGTEVSRGKPAADQKKYPLLSKVNGIFGQFRYRDTSGGRIEVDPQWVAENIVTITLPGLNQKVQVHKDAADHFIAAFNYIKNGTAVVNGKEVPLLSLIKTMDGTYVTRHVYWDPSRGLSNHSWGTAIDINANGHFGYVDTENDLNDPNLILWKKAFEPAGFSWGNRYGDSMHFELIK